VNWISVKDRLPEERETVLVFIQELAEDKENIAMDVSYVWSGKFHSLPPITHWMPLPEPPK